MGISFTGNYPNPDIYPIKLQHYRCRFTNKFYFRFNDKRTKIWSGFVNFYNSIPNRQIVLGLIANGSYSTLKEQPNDIDISLIYDGLKADHLNQNDREKFMKFINFNRDNQCKFQEIYYTHNYINIPYYPTSHRNFRATIVLINSAILQWSKIKNSKGRKGVFLVKICDEFDNFLRDTRPLMAI